MGDAAEAKEQVTLSLELVVSMKPAKVFKEFVQPEHHVTSLDFDDRGELCVTASDDETIQLYNCRSGKYVRALTQAHKDAVQQKIRRESCAVHTQVFGHRVRLDQGRRYVTA